MSASLSTLARLAREIREVVPGTSSVSVYPSGDVLVIVDKDEHVSAFAEQYGTLTVVREPLECTWLECVVMLDGAAVTVMGPHTEINTKIHTEAA